MGKILYIIGSTATGKTELALALAARFSGEIIAADSRQVYQGMTIGSGKDIPKDSQKKMSSLKINGQKIFYYQTPHTRLWGYDLASPKEDFSVAIYKAAVDQIRADIEKRGMLPIVVGGTGFYVESIDTPPESLSIPVNPELRLKLKNFTVRQLQGYLQKKDSSQFNALNNSDSHNPRRLIRKIEIVEFLKNNQLAKHVKVESASLWIGLDAPIDDIEQKIELRVYSRIKAGFEEECESLHAKGLLGAEYKSATATGYRQWLEYNNEMLTKDEYIAKWITAEKQYAKRQKTWFKNTTNCTWLSAGDPENFSKVVQMIESW